VKQGVLSAGDLRRHLRYDDAAREDRLLAAWMGRGIESRRCGNAVVSMHDIIGF
jgi:hypothetical protein